MRGSLGLSGSCAWQVSPRLILIHGPMAQLVERLPCTEEVSGSNPLGSISIGKIADQTRFFLFIPDAQDIPHRNILRLEFMMSPIVVNGIFPFSLRRSEHCSPQHSSLRIYISKFI